MIYLYDALVEDKIDAFKIWLLYPIKTFNYAVAEYRGDTIDTMIGEGMMRSDERNEP